MILDQNDPKELARYQEFVRNYPDAQYTQDTAWADVKSNWTPEYIFLENTEGDIYAALSIIMIEALTGKMFMYAPKGPVCDFRDTETVEALISEAQILAEKYDAFLLRIDPEYPEDDKLVEKYRSLGYKFRSKETYIHDFTQPRYNMLMDFSGISLEGSPDDEEYGFELFSSKMRSNIRRAIRDGAEVAYVNGEDVEQKYLDAFYEQIVQMAERQGINHRPKVYFERLLAAYPESRLCIIKHEEDVLCSSISIPFGNKVMYLYAGSSNVKRNINSSELMIYELFKWTYELGKKYFDFGGVFSTDRSDGLYKFKRRFTGDEGLHKFIGELDVVYDELAYAEYLKK